MNSFAAGLAKGIKYSFHVLLHPFEGFYDIKFEKKGNPQTSAFYLIMMIITLILQRQYSGFVVNTNRPQDMNVFMDIIAVLLPFGLWCLSNWCLTTLTEGEGSLKDIFIYSGYALLPMILINLPLILYSQLVTLDEIEFYSFFSGLAIFLMCFYMIIGTLITHQFTLLKTLFSIVVIIIGMAVITFIGLLLFNLIQQMAGFVINIYKEYTFRI